MAGLRIFISYSHQNETEKDYLVQLLKPLQQQGLVQVWYDRLIDGGNNWRQEIAQAMADCNLALLLVSVPFLASDFIHSEELKTLHRRREQDGLRVVALILKPCLWQTVPELEPFQSLPRDGKPLSTFPEACGERDQAWQTIGEAIVRWAKEAQATAPSANPLATPTPPAPSNPFDPWTPALPPHFVGRADELARLRDALDHGRSVSLVGDWRMGKTSLLGTWAQQVSEQGRVVRQLSGEGPEAVTCAAFVAAITGTAPVDQADPAADALSAWASAQLLPPLLVVDEAAAVLRQLPPRFFERLRGMLDRLRLVFCTPKSIDAIYAELGHVSPFANRLEQLQLGLLAPDAAHALRQQGAARLTAADFTLLQRWAGRHPYYLALLGHELWQAALHGEARESALARAESAAEPRLRQWFGCLQAAQQEALRQFAQGVVPKDYLLRQFRLRGLLDGEHLFGEALATWLQQN